MKDKDKYALRETAKDAVLWLLVVCVGFALGWLIASFEPGIRATVALIVGIPWLVYLVGKFIEHRRDY